MEEKPLHIFISYSWDDEAHKEWVKKLADYLIEKGGCEVTLDQYDLTTGGNTMLFMEKAVNDADKVLLILTPNYKLKADGRQGGVGAEYSMISQGLYGDQTNNTKFLPILRKGSLETSAPTFVQTTIYHDMSNDLKFEKMAFDLLRVVHGKPELVKPKRGKVPDFNSKIKNEKKEILDDGFAESARRILEDKRLKKEINRLYNSIDGVRKVSESVIRIFEKIEIKAQGYSIQMKQDFYVERAKKHNAIRVQVDDFFVNLYYGEYPYNSVRQLLFDLRSGKNVHYDPTTRTFDMNAIQPISHDWQAIRSETIYPDFDKSKNVIWSQKNRLLTEDDIVSLVFSKLLDAMIKEEPNHG
ncbi:toll/interleukin-1 receptor domain-containing protein [Nonlabens sp. SCSIO 43208]|uniref:toll/interleukin-1 receptor domain-containing protein n=1 Tax=Nonlabens sp. SCSIO 43208 TaxID=2793009 RepID=UPI003D6C5BC2